MFPVLLADPVVIPLFNPVKPHVADLAFDCPTFEPGGVVVFC